MLLSKATYKGENSQAKSNKKHGVTINTTLHKKYKNEIGNKTEVQECTCYKCKLSTSRSASEEGKCFLKSWVFKSFLKVDRDAPALVVLGSSFHQRGTTTDNSLDCRTCTDGSAKRLSQEERSILGVTFALTRAFKLVGAEPSSTL